jgi:hypothetical protein
MKKITLFVLSVTTIITISAFDLTHSMGIIFETGSPYDASNCSACHGGGATTPLAAISSNPAFGAGNTYLAGTTYTINVTGSGSYPKYGFDLEILNSTSPTTALDAGVFGSVVTSNCQVVPSSGQPTNVTHTAPTGSSNSATFSFKWTAPSSGTAYLYCAVNGVNGTGNPTGDHVSNLINMPITPSLTAVISPDANLFNLTIFPNPAGDYATIDYTLEENTDVKVELYDISGKKVTELLCEKQNIGQHHQAVNLAAMNLKSGVYSMLLKAGEKASAKRLIVQ